ncbi:hypothetical protein [Roseateles sp.]|uniref:hypothetical protein n=1 Tax=Roseateles sp. TaxID=1971397 RepID=UPI002E00DD79|nr:hypothetical protein [Roseateles sp.]
MAADDINAIVVDFQTALAKSTEFHKNGKKVLAELQTLKKSIDGYKLAGPDLKKKGWLKSCETLGADKTVLQALKTVETKNSRASCEAAYKLMKDDKKLKKVADEIQAVLRADEKLAQGLSKALGDAKVLASDSQKLKAASHDIPAVYTKYAKEIAQLAKELRDDKG